MAAVEAAADTSVEAVEVAGTLAAELRALVTAGVVHVLLGRELIAAGLLLVPMDLTDRRDLARTVAGHIAVPLTARDTPARMVAGPQRHRSAHAPGPQLIELIRQQPREIPAMPALPLIAGRLRGTPAAR